MGQNEVIEVPPEYTDSMRIADSLRQDTLIHVVTYTQAEFPGGNEKLGEYFNNNILLKDIKPIDSLGFYGSRNFYFSFVIEKDGKITNVKPLRSSHPEIENYLTKVLLNMPYWTPGKNAKGENLRSSFRIPIRIKIE